MSINEIFPDLVPPIRYPGGYTKETLFDYLNDFRLNGVESAEFSNYLAQDLNRFVYTLNLLPTKKQEIRCWKQEATPISRPFC